MLGTNPAAILNQKLPTEIIGIICRISDFETHNAIRSTCSSVRHLRKVVGYEEYKELITLCKITPWWRRKDIEKIRVFQERIQLALHHESLTQNQVEFLQEYDLYYELCRIARKVLDHPQAYNGIDLLFKDFYFLAAASQVGDLELFILLLQIPLMNPAADDNRAIKAAAWWGRLEVVQFLLQDPRVDPTAENNNAIIVASHNGHLSVVQALLLDPRVDPTSGNNNAIGAASHYGHLAVVQALLLDARVDPSDQNNYAIRWASLNGHSDVVQALLLDSRVDPSADDNLAIIAASDNGHAAVVLELLQDSRIEMSYSDVFTPLQMDMLI